MKLPEIQQLQFKGSAQGQAFDPVQIPDPNPRIQENLATIARSFENIEKSGQQQFRIQEQQAKQMEQLFEFAPKFIAGATEIQYQVRDKLAKEWAAKQVLNMTPAQQREVLDRNLENRGLPTKQEERDLDEQGAELATDLNRTPGNSEFVSNIVGAVGLRKKHININVAKNLAYILPEWVNTQLKENSGMIEVNGEMLQINGNHPPSVRKDIEWALVNAAMGIDEISGNDAMPLEIFAEHGMPLLRQTLNVMSQRNDKTWRTETGIQQRNDLDRKFLNTIFDPSLTPEQRAQVYKTHVEARSNTFPVSGEDRGVGTEDALRSIKELQSNMILSGQQFDLDMMGDMPVGPKGQPLKEWNKKFYLGLKANQVSLSIQHTNNERSAKQNGVRNEVAAALKYIEDNPDTVTPEMATKIYMELDKKRKAAGMTLQASNLDQYQSTLVRYGKGATEREDLIVDAQSQALNGTLTKSHELFSTPIGRLHPLYAVADQYDKMNLTPELKRVKEAVVDQVSKRLNVAKNLHGGIDGYAGQISDEIYESVRESTATKLAEAKTPEERSRIVSDVINGLTDEGSSTSIPGMFKKDSGSIYELDVSNKPTKWLQRGDTERTMMERQLAHITSVAKESGDVFKEIQDNPSGFVSRSVASTDMNKFLSGQGVGSFYQVAMEEINQAAGKQIIKHPMQLLAAVYRSYEPNDFNASKIEEILNKREELSPSAQTFFDRLQSGQFVNFNGQFRHGRETVREGFNGRIPPVASAIAAVGTQKTYTQQQRAFANRVYELAKANGARWPEVAAAIASLETGFGRVQKDNNVFNLRASGGGFEKFATLEAAVKRYIKLWDKNHSGFKNLESFDDPNEAFAAIVNSYAPAADQNNPTAYKQFVADFIKSEGYLLGR
jgi:hypothetical protein